jgi:hypothetical protein
VTRGAPIGRLPKLVAGVIVAIVAGLIGWHVIGQRATPPAERIVGLGFEDVVDHADRLPELAKRFDEVSANGVSISVGRADWTAFPWGDHSESWSSAVRSTGRDYVTEAIKALARDAHGRGRDVTAVVDVLAERLIADDPELAGVSADGKRSTSFPSLTALTDGPAGDRLIAFVAAVSDRYKPHAVSLTELFMDTYTFGDDDLASYRKATGAADWPRTPSGTIDTNDPNLGRWRSQAVASIVARARSAANASGVALHMEVRAPWSNPQGDQAQSGQDYATLLTVADRLVLWDYFALNDRPATYTRNLARALSDRAAGRIIMSVGLWAEEGTISPTDLRTASVASVEGGVNSVWVTPTSLMDPAHWEALRAAWNG